jgi:hypothetical protein
MPTNQKRAFILYDKKGRIVAGTLLIRPFPPKDGRFWVEVPYDRCCGIFPTQPVLSGIKQLKAYIKYTNQGIVVSSSTIIRRKKPIDYSGNWIEIPFNYCCQYTTTTTTTTTTTSSTTTTTTTVATTTTSSTTTTTTTA